MPVFKQIEPSSGPVVTFRFEGMDIPAHAGEPIAAALLRAGITVFRHTPERGTPRAAFCMMGTCYDCLVRIDGTTRQACMTPVVEGMAVTRGGA